MTDSNEIKWRANSSKSLELQKNHLWAITFSSGLVSLRHLKISRLSVNRPTDVFPVVFRWTHLQLNTSSRIKTWNGSFFGHALAKSTACFSLESGLGTRKYDLEMCVFSYFSKTIDLQ